MEEWKEYTVQELIDKGMLAAPMDGNHGEKHPKTGDYVPTGIPFIMANNLIGGTVDYKNCAFISKTQANSLDKGFAKPGDVLLTHKATIGRTAIVPNDYDFIVLTPQVTYYRPLKGIDNRFLKYYFDTVQFQSLFKNWAGAGSTRAYLGITAQRKLPIVLPDIGTQKKITSILKSLDDEIEVNRRINDNLEQQAQELFKSWFVDFEPFKDGEFVESELGMIPKGWRVGTFLDNIKVMPGGTPSTSRSEYWDDGTIPFFSPKDVNGVYCFETEKSITELGLNNCSSNLYPKDTLFITARGTVGKLTLAGVPMAMNQSNYALVAREGVGKYYLYLITQTLVSVLLKKANGAVFSAITTRDFNEPTLMPTQNDLKNFELLVTPIFKKIFQTSVESRRLADLRDTLLPKLMSGELKVGDVTL